MTAGSRARKLAPAIDRWRPAIRVGFLLYAATLLVATHWPRLQVPGQAVGSDKLIHFLAFAGWTLLAIASGWFGRAGARRNLALSTALALGYGTIDETSQLVPLFGRQFSMADMAANALGVLAASALAMMILRPSPEESDPCA